MDDSNIPPRSAPSAGRAVIIMLTIVALVAVYLGLGHLFGVQALWAGFMFSLYWAGIQHMSPAAYLPSLVGALGGIGMAVLCHWLPAQGTAGGLLLLGLVCLSIYMIVRGHLPILVNLSFMLFLTVATIPALAPADPLDMAAGVLLGAVYAGGLFWLAGRIGSWRSARAAASPAA